MTAIIEDLHRLEYETQGTAEMMCAYVGSMDAILWHVGDYAQEMQTRNLFASGYPDWEQPKVDLEKCTSHVSRA